MKRIMVFLATAVLVLLCSLGPVFAADSCQTIQNGTIIDANGRPVSTGYDMYGYNYQAHIFNGFLENYSRPATPVTESDTVLIMKWSDSWLANKDCNADGKLDRGIGTTLPGISQGWCTNHFHGSYLGTDGETYNWTEQVKIVYMPTGCDPANQIWGSYCIIEDVYNDPHNGFHGPLVKDQLVHPGLGLYK